jgi:hypothetical protein
MTTRYPIPLSMNELLAEARCLSGINIIDTEVREPLEVLLHSLNTESHLHKAGAVAMQGKLLRLLCNRLRMMRDFAAHPEIADQKINNPLFVLGMARSGTTKTHRVLSSTGDFNYMPYWQVQYPALFSGNPQESPQARIDAADNYLQWLDQAAPESKTGHSFETFAAEEDSLLTEQCFVAPSFFAYSEVPSYMAWFMALGSQGMIRNFKFLKNVLKYLQWQGLASPDKPWVLKAPTYYGFEPELLSVFPDAKLVMTHRTPLATVPSICKLLEYFHMPFDDARLDPIGLQGNLAELLKLHLHNRTEHANITILDIPFEDVVQDTGAVIEEIYRFAGISFTDATQQKVHSWNDNNPIHSKGKFKYSLEEFGLTKDAIQDDMAGYIAFINTLKARRGK